MITGFPQTYLPAHFTNSFIIEAAHLDRFNRIKICKPVFDGIKTGYMLLHIFIVRPPFSEHNCDHSAGQECVSSRPDCEMDIGNLRRFRFPRINNYQQLVGIFGKFFQHNRCPGHLMTRHTVPADSHQHIGTFFVGDCKFILFSRCASMGPELTGQFLCNGIIMIT